MMPLQAQAEELLHTFKDLSSIQSQQKLISSYILPPYDSLT